MSQMQGWYEFNDEDISMHIPGYLRPKKGRRYFAPYGRRGRGQLIRGIAVDVIQSPERVDGVRSYLQNAKFIDWHDVKQQVVRRGEVRFVPYGYELLWTRYNTSTQDILPSYHVIFRANSTFIYLLIDGSGQIAEFEAACHQIASSLHLKTDLADPDPAVDDRPSLAEPSNAGSPPSAATQESRSRSYLVARAKASQRPVHSVMILGDPVTGGVRLFLLSKFEGSLLPCGSTWHETEQAAKAEARDSMGIEEADWKAHEGEPDWNAAFLDAVENTITAIENETT